MCNQSTDNSEKVYNWTQYKDVLHNLYVVQRKVSFRTLLSLLRANIFSR